MSSLIPSFNQAGASAKPVFTSHEVGETGGAQLLYLPVDQIDPNPFQPRDTFAHGSMEDLMNSIQKHGVLEPILVTRKSDGRYELISGERRLRAVKMLGLPNVPALIRHAEDLEKLELALIENLQRQDLNAIEEAEGYHQLVDAFNLTQEETAKRVGKSREAVANALRLLSLSGDIQAAIAEGKITPTHGRLLLQIESPKERQIMFEQMLKDKLTIREAEMRGQTQIKRRKAAAFKDPKILGMEESLRGALGTKVSIEKRGKDGKIMIEFYSEEELENIVNRITQ